MWNDVGSVRRDRGERCLNSLDFPEFGEGKGGEEETGLGRKRKRAVGDDLGPDGEGLEADVVLERGKEKLMRLAKLEREFLELALEALGEVVGEEGMRGIRVFVMVTLLFGELYVCGGDMSRRKVER